MIRLLVSTCVVLVALGTLLWMGDKPERRYESEACPHRIIYDYTPDPAMGLVTLGGSRVRVSTSEPDFNAYLAAERPDAVPMHSVAHSIFSLEKEYVILRDLLENHAVKSVIIMIEPRRADFGAAHPDFTEIARLKDIPLAVSTLWPESPINAVRAARDIIFQHLDIFDKVGEQHRQMTVRGCDALDYRLDVGQLDQADRMYRTLGTERLEWDLMAPEEEGFLRWMAAYRALAQQTGTEIMFLLMTATSEPLPPDDLEIRFENITGLPLITLDRDMHDQLVAMGKRDSGHINKPGRDIFIPWLVAKIESKCRRTDGCF